MALLFMDSFDHYATADLLTKWTATSAGGSGSPAPTIGAVGRHSSNGLSLKSPSNAGNAGPHYTKILAPGDATIICGVAFNPVTSVALYSGGADPETTGAPNCCTCVMAVRLSGAVQAFLRVNLDGTLSAYRGPASSGNGTLLATSSATLAAATYNYLEVKITIHGSAGVFIVRLNGNPTPIINFTGNTQSQGSATWNEIRLGRVSTSPSSNQEAQWDDLYVLDGTGVAPWNAFLGDVRVDARFPTGAGATAGWTPSTGANYAAVDETAPNGDTDYVSATTVPVTDSYVTQDAPVAGATIFGVQHCLSFKKVDAGTCAVAPLVRIGGTDYVGADLFPATAYAYGLQVAQVSPATSAQWSESEFNGAEFGMKRTA